MPQFFPPPTCREAIVYCHVRGVKVHLTLNTLVLDREMQRAADLIRMAAAFGVDAFIVRIWAWCRCAKRSRPTCRCTRPRR